MKGHLKRRHEQLKHFRENAHAQLASIATVHELEGARFYQLPEVRERESVDAFQYTLPGVVP